MITTNIKNRIIAAIFLASVALFALACSDGSGTSGSGMTDPGTSNPGMTDPGTVEPAMTDAEAVAVDTAALSITYGASDSASRVTGDLALPTSGSNGSTINWSSTDTGTVATDGTVTTPAAGAGDVTVTLTATITRGSTIDTKVFNLTVRGIITGVTAVSGAKFGAITLSWDPSAAAASYNIYYNTSPGVTAATGIQRANYTSPYIHTGRTPGTEYYYIVTAVGAAGESSPSKEVTIYPYLSPMKTYQTSCYDSTGNTIPCAGTGQDGEYQYGRAAVFTGPTQHVTYTSDYTTYDNATGLIWRTCPNGVNGADCATGTAAAMNWTDASGAGTGCGPYNTIHSGTGYASIPIWRLPTIEELETLVKYSASNPAAFASAFPGQNNTNYWSSTEQMGNSPATDAYILNLTAGETWYNSKTWSYNVRCVAFWYSPVHIYVDNGDGTVWDKGTGLTWQKCSRGQNSDASCSGTVTTANWADSLSYCNNLTLAGKTWRLPNINELKSIVNRTVTTPTIDTTVFPATESNLYMSSTSSTSSPTYNWDVNFLSGERAMSSKNLSGYVRCVAD